MATCIKCEACISDYRITEKGKKRDNIFCKSCFFELGEYFRELGKVDGKDYSNWLELPEIKEWISLHLAERYQNRQAEKYCISGNAKHGEPDVKGKRLTVFEQISGDGSIQPSVTGIEKKLSPRVIDWKIQWLWQDYDFGATIIKRIIENDSSEHFQKQTIIDGVEYKKGDAIPNTNRIKVSRAYIDRKIAEFKANGFRQNSEYIELRKTAQKLERQLGTDKWNQLSIRQIAQRLLKHGIAPEMLLPLFQSDQDR